MIELLITIIIFAIVAGLLYWLVGMLPIHDPFATIIKVCCILICILLVIGIAFGGVHLPVINFRH